MTAGMEVKGQPDLAALVAARFEQSMSVPEAFFASEAGRIAEACWAIARRFHQGGRLLAFGNGAWKKAYDATLGKSGSAAPTPPTLEKY